MRILIFTLAVSCLTAAGAQAQIQSGFQLGAGIASNGQETKENIGGTLQKLGTAKTGAALNLYGGYDQVFGEHWLVGIEAGALTGSLKSSKVFGATTYTDKTNSEFDLSVRGGYVAGKNLLLFARLGTAVTEIQRTPGDIGVPPPSTRSKTFTAPLVGLGAEYAFGRWSLRGELDSFGKTTGTSPNNYQLSKGRLLIGLAYRF